MEKYRISTVLKAKSNALLLFITIAGFPITTHLSKISLAVTVLYTEPLKKWTPFRDNNFFG